MIRKWIWNILIALDQLANAILGGDPDETLSSRFAKHRGHGCIQDALAQGLDAIDPGHSDDSIEMDEGKDRVID